MSLVPHYVLFYMPSPNIPHFLFRVSYPMPHIPFPVYHVPYSMSLMRSPIFHVSYSMSHIPCLMSHIPCSMTVFRVRCVLGRWWRKCDRVPRTCHHARTTAACRSYRSGLCSSGRCIRRERMKVCTVSHGKKLWYGMVWYE